VSDNRPNHPLRASLRRVIALILVPALAVLSWVEAGAFDRYSMSYFTKTHVAPTPS
jgi:hypothetical protein